MNLKSIGYIVIGVAFGALVGLVNNANVAEKDESLLMGSSHLHPHAIASFEIPSEHFDYLTNLLHYSNDTDGCGANENATSINITAVHFGSAHVERARYDGTLDRLIVRFRAYDQGDHPRIMGGDEFRVTFWAYTDGTAVKTAAIAADLLDGTYHVSLTVPRYFDQYRMELIHLYTCFDGYRRGCVPTRFY